MPTVREDIRETLLTKFRQVREQTTRLCETLEPEDFVVQAMPDASPTKWHLAHTTWFFETFVLAQLDSGYVRAHADANYLFNSYYNAVGERIARDRRGLLSRPTISEIHRYRQTVDDRMLEAISSASGKALSEIQSVLILGLNHEQQHQELILMDIKAAFGANPVRPVFQDRPITTESKGRGAELRWVFHQGGLCEVGGGLQFHFDNERPHHTVYLEPFEVASRLVTNAEYLAFMDDGGYTRPEFWLSDGWAAKTNARWEAPHYWERRDGQWWTFTLSGMQKVSAAEPVFHVSFYEADAFARWSEARLPTEAEWEQVATPCPIEGHFLEAGVYQPMPAEDLGTGRPLQIFGDVWEWTASPYTAYPGYRPASGSLGEYNGKFMCTQMVLRGGACVTPQSHIRPTYRNFFGPASRWQFAGIRLAR